MNKILTEQGYKKIKDELEFLKKEKLPEYAKRIAEAKELGDLSENAEYQEAKDEQGMIARRINDLEEVLRIATVTNTKNINTSIVEIGNIIEVESDGKKYNFTIVSSNEVNPESGKISNESPLGQSFLGRKSGEVIEIEVPKGKITYKILNIK
jgi:transcription elongation factor GreA